MHANPYFAWIVEGLALYAALAAADVPEALERVQALGGSVVHPGERWAICRDSEGSPFGLTRESPGN